jgi:hypothetical protein
MSPLFPNRTYRTAKYDASDDTLSEVTYEGDLYQEAHYAALQEDYDWPAYRTEVELSEDGGVTWVSYMGEEFIDGKPAWTYPDL